MIRCRLGVTRQHQAPAIGGGQMHIDHLDGRELFQDGPRGEARRERPGELFERDVEAVGDEGDKDVRFDPRFKLMEDRADGQIVFEFLERLFDLGEAHVVTPQRGRVFAGEVGAQQIPAFPAADAAQFVASECEGEGVRGDRVIGFGQVDADQAISASGLLPGGAKLEQQRVAAEGLALQLA